jgi:hypothetical protein
VRGRTAVLEKRTENDVKRNAMVGIFLRLLEYHQGVLFLTTNRVKCFGTLPLLSFYNNNIAIEC